MSARRKATKRAKLKPKQAPPKKQALARARETHVLPSHDIADEDDIVRHMSTEDLAHSPQTRALAVIHATQQPSAAQQLAYGAFLDLLDTDQILVVREDDGSLWAFVKDDPSPDRWRGAIRRRGNVIEESWFLPHEGKIVWELIRRARSVSP